jgi:hypothetical protein
MRAFDCVGKLMVLGLVGCSEKIPPQAPPAPIVESLQASPMPEIKAGARPAMIRHAKLFRVHQFVAASDNDDLQVGDMVCT